MFADLIVLSLIIKRYHAGNAKKSSHFVFFTLSQTTWRLTVFCFARILDFYLVIALRC